MKKRRQVDRKPPPDSLHLFQPLVSPLASASEGGGCLWNDVAQQALRLSLNSLSLSLSLSPLLFSRALSRIKIGAGRFSKKLCRIHISLIWRSLFFSAPLVFCFLSKNRISRFPRCALATLSAAGDLVSPRGGDPSRFFSKTRLLGMTIQSHFYTQTKNENRLVSIFFSIFFT